MIKGYIFDLDGTLIDSMDIWLKIGTYYLQSLNIIPENHLDDILAPLTIDQAIDYLSKQYSLAKDKNEVIKELNDLLLKQYQQVKIKPGVISFLKNCKKLKKKTCLLTANNTEITNIVLNKYNLNQYFDLIMTCNKTTSSKQDGQVYLEAIDQLQLDKSECIIIEDAIHAIIGAKKVNCQVWAVQDISNINTWDKIIKISDRNYQSIAEMEVI